MEAGGKNLAVNVYAQLLKGQFEPSVCELPPGGELRQREPGRAQPVGEMPKATMGILPVGLGKPQQGTW